MGPKPAEERATIRKDGRTSQLEDSLTHSVEKVETISGFSTGNQDGTATKAGIPGEWRQSMDPLIQSRIR